MIDLWEGAIPVNTRQFWARASTRELSAGIKPQETLRLYTIAFQCESVSSRVKGSERDRQMITPIKVQVLHLPVSRKVLVQYSLVEPDSCDQDEALSEPEMRRIEPKLALMVKQAMQNAGIGVSDCRFEAYCTGSNLVRDRGTGGAT